VKVAPNFYGYIKGIKYFRNLQISKDPDYFTDFPSTNTSLLFYYKFSMPHYSKLTFDNLAEITRFQMQPILFNDTIFEINPLDGTQNVVRHREP
jgi:hypothetical protein